MLPSSRAFASITSWNHWWSRPYGDPAQVRDFQTGQLRRIVRHAASVPYYAALFHKAGMKPEDIRDVDDLPRIPLSSKRALLGTPIERLLTPETDLASCLVRHSSGSTGEPSVIVRSHPEQRKLRLYAL